MLGGLGTMGKSLIETFPDDWAKKLEGLRKVDWRRTNAEWQGIAMSGTDVVNRRQSRVDTAAFIKRKLDLELTPGEKRSLESATDVKSVMKDLRRFAAKK